MARLGTSIIALAIFLLPPEAFAAASPDFVDAFEVAEIRSETIAIDFGTPAARPNMLGGFSTDEREPAGKFAWSIGARSEIEFVVTGIGPRRFVIRCAPLVYEGVPPQVMSFRVNGRSLPDVPLQRETQNVAFEVSGDILRIGTNALEIHYSARAGGQVVLDEDPVSPIGEEAVSTVQA